MAGLDFLQAMSNTASDAVAGPVDIVSWLMKKAGIPVGDAVGGTAWQEAQGLRRPVAQSPEALAGETLGLLSPIAAAAKAPQIARGLLQAGDNLAAPRTLNPETGAIVWHGSPHKFDKFDASKIGTGEGAQAYGHGLYLAESPDVAKAYRAELARTDFTYADEAAQAQMKLATNFDDHVWGVIDRFSKENAADPKATAAALRAYADRFSSGRDAIKKAADLMDGGRMAPTEAGALYKVDLPDDAIARMLDWDRPLSQQAPEVKKLVNEMLGPPGSNRMLDDRLLARPTKGGGQEYSNNFGAAYNSLTNRDQIGMSQRLRDAGVPGIKYLDGGSRGAGQGSSNFVVFPGEEDILKILERNGQPLGLLGR